MTMVEKVARAIAAHTGSTYDPLGDQWCRIARAAIQAMRVPTPAMIEAAYAGYLLGLEGALPRWQGSSVGAYQAMIDASLPPDQAEETR